eukprot:s1_g2306.t1
MTAIKIPEPGGPDALVPTEVPVPQPGHGEILVRIEAAGVNRGDLVQRIGLYPPPKGVTDTPGLEFAGEAVALGSGASRWSVGDKVCALVAGGGYAEYAIVHETHALPVPDGYSMVEAAALPETIMTVWTNVFDRGRLRPGETLLIHGGTSGIGTTAIQMAVAWGAKVFATAGSDEKARTCEELGARRGINYRTEDFVMVMDEATSGQGADVIFDMVGGDYIQRNITCAARGGRIVNIAYQQGSVAEVNFLPLMLKQVTLTGSTLRARPLEEKTALTETVLKEAPVSGKGSPDGLGGKGEDMSKPLMPKAAAVWLVDNTSLTFDQVADYCGLHPLEVKGIADGDVAQGIKGMDPVASGELTRAEIERCQEDPNERLKSAERKHEIPAPKPQKGPRYTPVSRRQDRPDAIAWLLRNHPELADAQIGRLVGTTKPTIQSIRDRTHWNSPNIKPVDPVTLGLCSQMDLDAAVQKAADKLERARKKAEKEARKAGTLLPAEETTGEATADPLGLARPSAHEVPADQVNVPSVEDTDPSEPEPFAVGDVSDAFTSAPAPKEEEPEIDPDSVFAKLKDLNVGSDDENKE